MSITTNYHALSSDECSDKKEQPYLGESVIQRLPIVKDDHVRFCATWRGTALIGASIASAAFVLNLAVLIWAVTFPLSNGFAAVYIGAPRETQRLDVVTKLFINIISTAILISSSRCTQFLCSPTRSDINTAHRQGTWLDIGVRSWRNFKAIDGWRRWLAVALFVSSVPVHLIYNSTVLATAASREYVAVTVDPTFVLGVPANELLLASTNETDAADLYQVANDLQQRSDLLKFAASDCKALYKSQFQSQYGNLLLVSSEVNSTKLSTHNQSIIAAFQLGMAAEPGRPGSYAWWYSGYSNTLNGPFPNGSTEAAYIAPLLNPSNEYTSVFTPAADCALSSSLSCSSDGNFSLALVDYCLVEPSIQESTFTINIGFLVVMVFANAVKALLLLWASRKPFLPLTTTGDAIASFLAHPDEYTARLGPISVSDIGKGVVPESVTFTRPKKQLRWFASSPPFRWVLGTVTLLIPLGIGIFVLLWSLPSQSLGNDDPDLVRVTDVELAFNAPAMITFGHSFVAIALVVNAPQILLTLVYLCVNNLLTNMALVHEYHSYISKRKALRVTQEQGSQRTTYFLSLPNKYAVPLVVLWTMIHWCIAQSISLLRVNILDHNDVQKLNYTAIVVAGKWFFGFMVPTIVLALTLVLLGIRKLNGSMPLARTCSLALSAVCHRSPKDDADMVLKALQFGVIPGESSGSMRCIGFSDKAVEPIEAGVVYTSCGAYTNNQGRLDSKIHRFHSSNGSEDTDERSTYDFEAGEAHEMTTYRVLEETTK